MRFTLYYKARVYRGNSSYISQVHGFLLLRQYGIPSMVAYVHTTRPNIHAILTARTAHSCSGERSTEARAPCGVYIELAIGALAVDSATLFCGELLLHGR